MTARQALAVLLAAGFGGFAWLSVTLLTGHVHLGGHDEQSALRSRFNGPRGQILAGAVAAGLLTLALTGWVAAAAAAAGMVVAWPQMFGAARQQQAVIGRLEALATWIESLRDTIATGVALPEAIPVTARSAPAQLARPLQDLVARMQAREPLDQALLSLADDLNDAVADQAIAALALNAQEQGKKLKAVLTALAEATRKQVEARRAVEADRRSTRQGVRIIMIVTALFVVGLALFNRGYVEPFRAPAGQIVLAVAVGFFALGFTWMHRLSSFQAPARFLDSRVSNRRSTASPATAAQLPAEMGVRW